MERETYFVDVLLPLPLPYYFTYRLPWAMEDTRVDFGTRVVVPFGRSKLYAGLVIRKHNSPPSRVVVKYVSEIIDDNPIISEKQFALWQWIADYYLCTLGEVMSIALPSALKLAGETKITIHPRFDGDISLLDEKEMTIVDALSRHYAMSLEDISKTLQLKKVLPVVKTLVEKGVIITDEDIRDIYRPKREYKVSLLSPHGDREENFYQLLDRLGSSTKTAKQSELLLTFFMLLKESTPVGEKVDFSRSVSKNVLLQRAQAPASRLQSLINKNICLVKEVVISRLATHDSLEDTGNIALSPAQATALCEILYQFEKQDIVLLQGVTGSGKTELYIKLIARTLAEGKQVLYLLPEIALTTQIVNRLRKYFGDKVGVYHSRFNEFERVEIWNQVLGHGQNSRLGQRYPLVIGARSALLLPFRDLGLIIVDEEHDASYKQMDPAPRYHARDGAIVLAKIHGAKVLLGTATPSIESYFNAKHHKYGYVSLTERFSGSALPEIWLADIAENTRQKKMQGHFTAFLLEQMKIALAKGEQVIIFQNRRGFSLCLYCHTCQQVTMCARCDVSLTYHKQSHLLKCHYCGYAVDLPEHCPHCGSKNLEMKGFGTEKVVENIAELLPEARVARMDLDTTRSKTAYQQMINDFEQHETDILVGTQMVTKGLDFDRVSVVGILNADNLINYPDFRSFERAFQILSQVSGRAGRRDIPGKVIIQSYHTCHPALQYVVSNDYEAMYAHQIVERERFHYPPFYRLVKITLKHPDEQVLNQGAFVLGQALHHAFPRQVLGPEFPVVAKVQNYYLKDLWIKLQKNSQLKDRKNKLLQVIDIFKQDKLYKNVRVVINVDA
ncbi:MAG: primosomal protein N' [Bacteroidales bacterium]|jgi:primosomal protein N' (replication factor Y)|nr:primosomal protein N' [Bacteroidales bacterium]